MQYDNRKISIRQLFIIIIVAAMSSIIQVVPRLVGGTSGNAGWTAILAAFGFYTLLILMFAKMFGKTSATDLYELFVAAVGKILSKIIIAIYGIWTFVLIAFYSRAFAERFTATILPNTNPAFLLVLLLAICAVFAYGKLESFARFAELSLYLFAGIFIFLLAVSLPTIEIRNMLPVTTLDTLPILSGAMIMLGFWGYLTFGLFLSSGAADLNNFKKQGIKSGVYLGLFALITFVITIGILGANWASGLNLPFFTAVQTIRILRVVERLEALFLTFWVLADIVIVSLFLYVFLNILRKLLPIENPKNLTAPTVLGVFLLASVIAGNFSDLTAFLETFVVPANFILGIAVPAVIFAIGLLRKKF